MEDPRVEQVNSAIDLLKKGDINEEVLWNIALHGWWVGDRDLCLRCAQFLYWLNPHHSLLSKNLCFYTTTLNGQKKIIKNGFDKGFHPMNTSLCSYNNQYVAVIRTVNYTTDGQGSFNCADGIITRNWLAFFDTNFNLIKKVPIISQQSKWKIYGGCYEDIRIIADKRFPNRWKFLGCLFREGQIRQYIGTLSYNGEVAEVIGSYRIDYGGSQEKNWIPINIHTDGSMDAIYSYSPLILLNVTAEGLATEIRKTSVTNNKQYYRGGSNIFIINDRKIAVIHQYGEKNGHRLYVNRFIELNDKYDVIGFSDVFNCGSDNNIEFISGVAVVEERGIISLAVGVGDNMLMFLEISIDVVLNMIIKDYYSDIKKIFNF